jgi:RNA polymerase sigma-70 factor (ECF subfamily)
LNFLKHIPSTLSDHELVAEYKAGKDINVLGSLYARYMDLIYGVCLKYLKEPEDSKDAVINVFEELVGKLLKYEVDNFKSWLYQLAKNHCLMKIRSEKNKKPANVDVSLVQSVEEVHLNGELDKEEHFKTMEYCLSQLAEEQRQVITLFYLEGKCYNDIVEITGIEWNKIRSYIQNGRRNLKICMEKHNMKSVV